MIEEGIPGNTGEPKRYTSKQKSIRNKEFPYKRMRCEKCGMVIVKCECRKYY